MLNPYCIYKIVNPKGLVYIGQTKNFKQRIYCYKTLKCKSQHKIYRSIKKYGWECHTCKIIENNLTKEEVDIREVKYISHFKNKKISLNIRPGGSSFGASVFVKVCKFSLDGLLIKIYDKIVDAALDSNCSKDAIWRGIHNTNYSGGYLWAYYKDYKKGFIPKFITEKGIQLIVYQFNLQGDYIREFSSIGEAAKFMSVARSTISNNIYCRTNKVKDCVFSIDRNHIVNIKSKYITISCFNNKGDLFKIFDNDRIASEYFNVSRSWIIKKCKYGGEINGYTFKRN